MDPGLIDGVLLLNCVVVYRSCVCVCSCLVVELCSPNLFLPHDCVLNISKFGIKFRNVLVSLQDFRFGVCSPSITCIKNYIPIYHA